MLARAFSKPSLARSARFFMASSWPASATTFFIVSWRISACRRTRRCQPSKAILFASARASMFFRSRSTSAAKSTPGSRNCLISLVKSKNGVSPAAPFSVGLLSLDTVPFFVGLLSLDTVPFFVGLLSLDMMFPLFGLVERPRELVAASQICDLPGTRQVVKSDVAPKYYPALSSQTVQDFPARGKGIQRPHPCP